MAANTLQSATRHDAGLDYYPAALHEEALARLAFLARKGSASGLLSGPSGCGKSLVLSLFAREQKKSGAAVSLLSTVGDSAVEFLRSIAIAWGADSRVADGLPQLWQKVTDRLQILNFEQVPVLLLVDDLHQAREEVATLVDRIQAFASGAGKSLVLIASTENRSQGLLSGRLLSRVELRLELDAWTLEETGGFLSSWISQRVGEDQEFNTQAIEMLHDLAEGNPRRVRQLAEMTLVAGSGSTGNLSEEVVEAAYQELLLGR